MPVYRARLFSGFQHTIAVDRVVVSGDLVNLERRKGTLWVAALQLPRWQVTDVWRRVVDADGAVRWRPDPPPPSE